MKKTNLISLLSAAMLIALITGPAVTASGGAKIKVTVTNLTKGQIFSPFIVATHTKRLAPLFELGSPASDALAALAEDGDSSLLQSMYESSPHVKDVRTAGGPVLPGDSVSVYISDDRGHRYVTIAGMLVTTNDAFFALDRARSPRYGKNTYNSRAYDAGSEKNSEDCSFIPGPPCGSGGVHDPAEAEGYVYVHSGIHGIKDLGPEENDWRNPVAKVTIRRVYY